MAACSILEMMTMNELGQRALEVFRMYPSVMGMSDPELVAYCEGLGEEMEVAARGLEDDLWWRIQEENRDRVTGKLVSDGDRRAAMLRTAQAQAREIVMDERVYSRLADRSSEMPDGSYDESLPDMELMWHPDWVEMLRYPPWVMWNISDESMELIDQDDPWTWWPIMPTGVCIFLDPMEINAGLADGRLVWVDGEVTPRRRVERLAAEAQNGR